MPHRIFSREDKDFSLGQVITLDYPELHHLKDVLRLKSGEQLEVVANSNVYLSEITAIDPTLEIKLLNQIEEPQKSYTSSIIFSYCKSNRNELMIEKCTELGIDQIILYQAERSVAKISQNKVDRLNKIIYSAACQSKRNTISSLETADDPTQLLELLEMLDSKTQRFIGSLEDPQVTLFNSIQKASSYIIAIGPEGDFTPEEYEFFKAQDFTPVSLGNRVLRSETAAISTIATLELANS